MGRNVERTTSLGTISLHRFLIAAVAAVLLLGWSR